MGYFLVMGGVVQEIKQNRNNMIGGNVGFTQLAYSFFVQFFKFLCLLELNPEEFVLFV